jgi:hypothetical protein
MELFGCDMTVAGIKQEFCQRKTLACRPQAGCPQTLKRGGEGTVTVHNLQYRPAGA